MKPLTYLLKTSLIAGLSLSGCADSLSTTQQHARSHGAVLGHLQARDRKLTFYAGPADDGPRFSISGKDGGVIAAGLTAGELQAREPGLFRLYQSTLAHNRAGAGPLDARFQRQMTDEPVR